MMLKLNGNIRLGHFATVDNRQTALREELRFRHSGFHGEVVHTARESAQIRLCGLGNRLRLRFLDGGAYSRHIAGSGIKVCKLLV